jgi:putative phosphoesterase
VAILIVSDSHRKKEELNLIVLRHQHEVTAFIHCGDSELRKDDPILSPFQVVGGNCDFFSKMPKDLIVEADNMDIFVTHGHRYNVKYNRELLQNEARLMNCEVVCYGHSHQRKAEIIKGILLINPGSITQPRGPMEKTYAIVNKADEKYLIDFYDLNGVVIEHVEFDLNKH